MSKLQWDKVGERLYETGVDRCVLFLMGKNAAYEKGVPWNGLTAFNENPSGGEANPFYANNKKYLNIIAAEDFGFGLEAYTYPDEWAACDGSAEIAPGVTAGQQTRKVFGLTCRTLIGNDTEGQDHGYKLHLVYGAQASPSQRNHGTVNESPEPTTMGWDATTTPVEVPVSSLRLTWSSTLPRPLLRRWPPWRRFCTAKIPRPRAAPTAPILVCPCPPRSSS